MPVPQAILFGLDDTLITDGERHPILVQVAGEFGTALPGIDPTTVADRLEAGLHAFWSDADKARGSAARR